MISTPEIAQFALGDLTFKVYTPHLMDLLAVAIEADKVKAVGVSNYSAQQMRIAHAAWAKRGIPLAGRKSTGAAYTGREERPAGHCQRRITPLSFDA